MIVANINHLDYQEDIEKQLGSVSSNFIDTEIFQDALNDAVKVRDDIDTKTEETPFFKKLSEDIFHSLYKIGPKIYDKNNVVESLALENDILKEITNNEKFDKLRKNTAANVFNSTFSLNVFQEKASEIIEKWIKENEEKNKEAMDRMNKAIEKQEELRKTLDELQYDPNNQQMQDLANNLQNQVQNLNKQIAQDNKNGSFSGTEGLSSSLKQALNETQKETQDMANAMNNFFGNEGGSTGGDGEGMLKAVPFEERLRLSEQLATNYKLQEISKNLGRMKSMLNNIRKKPSKNGFSISDVGVGNNITKMLSTEKMLLIDPILEDQFYKKYYNKTLLEYKTNGLEEVKGPIVMCLDESGSMSGSRDCWAKAIAIVLLQTAMKDNRAFRCITFNRSVREVYDFEKKTFSTDKMLEMVTKFSGGGTNFELPLLKAIESVNESKYKKADIIFLTDGDPSDYLGSEARKQVKSAKESKDVNIQGILIDSHNTRYLEEFCDTITTFSDLNEDGALENIFKNVAVGADQP